MISTIGSKKKKHLLSSAKVAASSDILLLHTAAPAFSSQLVLCRVPPPPLHPDPDIKSNPSISPSKCLFLGHGCVWLGSAPQIEPAADIRQLLFYPPSLLNTFPPVQDRYKTYAPFQPKNLKNCPHFIGTRHQGLHIKCIIQS